MNFITGVSRIIGNFSQKFIQSQRLVWDPTPLNLNLEIGAETTFLQVDGEIFLTKAQNVISYSPESVISEEYICYTVELWVFLCTFTLD